MMNKMKYLLMLVLVMTVLAACGADDEGSVAQNEDNQTTEQGNEAFPVTLTDALNKEVMLEQAPKRIVSLIPSNTEILFGLGLDEEIVGVNDNDNYPAQAAEKEKIGGYEFNLEVILALQPDLVLAHEAGLYGLGDGIAQLEAAGIKVFVVKNAVDFEETYETIEQIGLLTGRLDEAKAINEKVQADIVAIQEKLKDAEAKSAFVVVGMEPAIYAAGEGSYIDEMLKVINVKNAVTVEGWPEYSAEDFVASDADAILVTYASDIEILNTNPAYAAMKAVQKGDVKLVDGDTTSRQGPRIAEGVASIAKALYPEVFGE